MLELRDLGFRYPGSERAALHGINLQLQAGECLGLLGSNGAGKTTLLSLLSGVLPLQQGELRWSASPRPGHFRPTHQQRCSRRLLCHCFQRRE